MRRIFVSRVLWTLVPTLGVATFVGCEDSGSPVNFDPNFPDASGFTFDGSAPDGSLPKPTGDGGGGGGGGNDAGTDATVDGKPLVEFLGSTIDFGGAECQSTPLPKSLTFKNTGTGKLTWSASLSGAGFALTSGASGSVEPGQLGTITIAPAFIPASTKVGEIIKGTLTVTTNVVPTPVAIPVVLTAHGSSLKVVTTNIGFGQIPIGSNAPEQQITIENVGDRAATIALDSPSAPEFQVTWTGAPTAASPVPAGGGKLPGAVAKFKASAAGTQSAKVGVKFTGPACAGDTPEVTLSGEGTVLPVTISPGILQFGATACGATANDRVVSIENPYEFALTYNAAITSGPYQLPQPTGTIPAKSTGIVTVKPSAVPAAPGSIVEGALAGTMALATTAPQSTPVTINLAQSATGAVLTLTPTSGSTIAFGNVVAGVPSSTQWAVRNTGNAPATVSVSTSGPFSSNLPGGGTIAATSADVTGSVTQTATQSGAVTGVLTVTSSTPVCQPAPVGTLNLTATVVGPTASIGTVPAMSATCGTQTAPAAVNVPVTNTGGAPLTISGASATGGFTVLSTFPINVPVGQTRNISVQPPAAVVGTDVGGSTKTGQLTITTNEAGNPTRTAALSSTINGASLRLVDSAGNPQPSVSFSSAYPVCPADKTIYIKNVGNQSTTVSISNSEGAYPFSYDVISSNGLLPAGGTVSHSLSVQSYGTCVSDSSVYYAATGNVCSLDLELTASLNVTGSSYCYCGDIAR